MKVFLRSRGGAGSVDGLAAPLCNLTVSHNWQRWLLIGLAGFCLLWGRDSASADAMLGEQRLEIWRADSAAVGNKSGVAGLELRQRLGSGAWGGPKDYVIGARLSWPTVPMNAVADALPLTWEHPMSAPNGWRELDGLVLHGQAQGRDGDGYRLPLAAPVFSMEWSGINDFDALWVDYRLEPGVAACGVSLTLEGDAVTRMGVDGAGPRPWLARYGDAVILRELQVEEAADAVWREKDYRYLLDRILGAEPDRDWRIARDGDNTVLQRRLHWPIGEGALLRIDLAPGTRLGGVNLFLRLDDRHGGGDLAQVNGVAAGPLPGGGYGVLIDLHKLATQLYPGAANGGQVSAWLNEVFLFLPGDEAAILRAKPVRRMALLEPGLARGDQGAKEERAGAGAEGHDLDTASSPPAQAVRVLVLTGQVEDQGQNWQRLMVDLGPLSDLGKLSWREGELSLKPAGSADACALRLGGVRLVSRRQAQVPAWTQEVRGWSQFWGGSWPPGLPNTAAVPAARVLADESLHLLQPVVPARAAAPEMLISLNPQGLAEVKKMALEPGVAAAWVRDPPRPAVTTGWLSASGRVHLRDTGGTVAVKDGVGAVVRGTGDRFVLDWALDTDLPPGTRLLIGHMSGAEQVARVRLRLVGPAGEAVEQWLTPGLATPLVVDAPGRVARAELEFEMARVPYEVALGHLTLLVPEVMDRRQALTAPFHWAGVQQLEMRLATEAVVALDERDGRGLSFWPAGVAEGVVEARARTPIQVMERLGLIWQVPVDWLEADGGDGCLLDAEFIYSGGREIRRICLNRAAGSRDFLAIELGLQNTGKLGRLESVRWHVRKPVGSEGVVNLQTNLQGRDLFSFWDRLMQKPVAHLDGKPVFADPAAWAAALPEAAERRGFWLEMPAPFTAAVLGDDQSALVGLKDAWLATEAIAIRPRQPLAWPDWARLTQPLSAPEGVPLWRKLLIPLLSLGSALLIWRLGWWPRLWAGTLALGKLLTWTLPRAVIAWVWRWGLRWTRWLNLLVGGVGVVALVLSAGLAGEGWRGRFLLISALILVMHVYHFWRASCVGCEGARSFSGRGRSEWVGLGVAILASVWALGFRGHDPTALWALVLLPVAGYGFLPYLVDVVGRLFSRHHAAAWAGVWVVLTLGLYLGGLLRPVVGGENYFFTFGGMAALTAAWYFLDSLRGRLEGGWPEFAGYIYRGAGSRFFSIALVLLVFTALFLAAGLEPVAEQVAVIVYYALVAGTVREVVALRREAPLGADKGLMADTTD